jgi:hypothetical protein
VSSEPTDEDLIAFADAVLGDLGDSFRDDDLLRETITHHRELWQNLYRISRATDTPAPGQASDSNADR